MQRCFLIIALFISTFTALSAATGKMAELQVSRFTRQGTGILVETGLLRAPSIGFVALNSTTYPESLFAGTVMTPAVITSINGKTLAHKPTIDLYNQTNPGFLGNYSFSKQVYPTTGGDCYIVTLAGGGGTKAPNLTVKASKTNLKEGPKTSASFVISLDKAPTSDIAVIFEFSGSVKGSTDYLSSHNVGSIKIKKGQKTGSVKITLRDDKLKEPTEKLVFTIFPHGGYKLGKNKTATITITDNDK